jgi:glutamate synthase domain-containing protein 1
MNKLIDLRQHTFDRDIFAKTVLEIIPDILDTFADHGDNFNTYEFVVTKRDDEFYVIHLHTGIMVSWYKHLGRVNLINTSLNLDDFKSFLKILKEDLDLLKKGCRK